MAMDKASKSCSFMKQISILEDKVSSLTAEIVHLEECDSFIVGIIESACELLRCKFSYNFPLLLFYCNAAGPLFLLLYVLAWTLSVKLAVLLNGSWLLRDRQVESKLFGLIPSAAVLLCFSKIVLNILEKRSMVVEKL
jgi:hypothetical protein